MEWRQQTSVSCADAFNEAQRWIEEVTGKLFGCSDFRAALENGVLLCDLINQLKPGIIKRVNRLSTPIAGLDNVNVFLKACGKLGLNESQLFHPGDLQDLSTRVTLRRDESSRRLKNVPAPDADANIHKCRDMSRIRVMMVLITIYWLGRKAQLDAFYTGPQLNFKAFEGLIGFTLSKAEGGNVFGKDGGYRESWLTERDERQHMRPSYKRENSLDSVDSLDARTLRPNSEGCGSDAEAEQVFRMETPQLSVHQNKGHVPAPLLRRKQGQEETGGVCTSPLSRVNQNQVRPETPVQVNPGWIWSKSLSDIPMVYPARKLQKENTIHDVSYDANPTRERNQKNTRKSSVTAKDSEAQWQDDLTKWKNRRRSTKSDLRRNSQDREHVINQMSNGAVANIENNEASNRDQPTSPCRNNPAPRLHSTSPPSKSSSSDLKPHTRALLARSYATEAPFSPAASLSPQTPGHTQGSVAGVMPASDGNILGEETHFASLASDGAGVTTPSLDCPFTSQTQFKAQDNLAPSQPTSELNQPENVFTNQTSTLTTTMPPNKATHSTSTSDPTTSVSSPQELQFCADPNVNQAAVDPLDYLSQQNHKSQEERQKMSWEPSVEQNRGQQAAGVYKYLYRAGSWSGSASLPRGYRRSDGSTRLSSAITARPFGTKQSRMSSLPRLCSVDDNQGVLLNSEKEKSLSPPNKSLLKRQTATGHLRGQYQASIRQKKANQAKQKSAKQMERKEERGANISSQANGYHHQPYAQTQILPQPYSNPQSQHSRSLSQPSKMDHSDMRVSLSLKPNSRPDFGFQTHWDSTGARVTFIQPGSPAELCRLSVGDEIVSVDGLTVAQMSYNQWTEKMTSALQAGSLTMDIRRYGNKDWSMSEGSHHNLPGQSRMTLNLTSAAPVLIGYPDHHANNTAAATESPVTKAAKFNGQTDNVIQGNMMDGGFADGRRTGRSKGGSESAISDLQVPSLSPSSSSWSWDREEDRKRQEKWQEEQERLLQEQYQRDQKRLEAEWQRAQQDVMGDFSRKLGMTNGVENLGSFQLPVNASANKIREEERSYNRDKLKTAGSGSSSNTHGVYNDKITEPDWAVESCGFAQLSPAHRAKSMSTPALGSPHRQMRGDQRKIKDQSVSKAEKERQQILEEMKKRTQLLTDNSWIRQRSSSFYKEPVYVGVPMKRYESLDDLDTLRQSPVSASTFSYPRPHSAAAGYCAPSRNSSSRYSTGAILTQRNPSVDSPHQGSVWAATDTSEELRPESTFKSETRSPTVNAAISNSSMLVPPLSDQLVVLQITE